ncbi:MAG: efflux RND transporter periplasmic adaptor subunit [Bacteroidales bacterium]
MGIFTSIKGKIILGFEFFFVLFLILACNNNEHRKNSQVITDTKDKDIAKVKVMPLSLKKFPSQTFVNAKLIAKNKVDLCFSMSGKLITLREKNGNWVKKGDVIACLDRERLALELRRAKDQLALAYNQLISLSLGFEPEVGDTAKISPKVLANLKLESGYNKALLLLKEKEINYKKLRLCSPIDGQVVMLEAHENQLVNENKFFCRVIDNRNFYVKAELLETELRNLHIGQSVQVKPLAYSEKSFKGKLVEINPQVSNKGLVNIKATVENSEQLLLDGMNVELVIEQNTPNQIVVPRDAIVLRSGKPVVFTYVDGKAYWNYVKTSLENDQFVCIKSGLKEEDLVIYNNNFHLNHNSPVEVLSN